MQQRVRLRRIRVWSSTKQFPTSCGYAWKAPIKWSMFARYGDCAAQGCDGDIDCRLAKIKESARRYFALGVARWPQQKSLLLEKPVTSMIAERLRPPVIALQGFDPPVPRHIHHLEEAPCLSAEVTKPARSEGRQTSSDRSRHCGMALHDLLCRPTSARGSRPCGADLQKSSGAHPAASFFPPKNTDNGLPRSTMPRLWEVGGGRREWGYGCRWCGGFIDIWVWRFRHWRFLCRGRRIRPPCPCL